MSYDELVKRLRNKAEATFECNKNFGRTGKDWAIETEAEWQAASAIEDLQRQLAEKDEALREADAFDIVAAWHEKNAAQFKQMANDDPRTGQLDRLKAAEAAKHHAGSAASLRIKASDIRRAHYAAIVAKQEKSNG